MWVYDDDNWHARSQSLPFTEEQCPGEEGGGGKDEEVLIYATSWSMNDIIFSIFRHTGFNFFNISLLFTLLLMYRILVIYMNF